MGYSKYRDMAAKYLTNLAIVLLVATLTTASLRSDLEDETGLEVESITFNNWASNVQHTDVLRIRPETRSQVTSTVQISRQHETRLRAAGLYHAFSDLFAESSYGLLVDMSNYRRNDDDRMYIAYASYYRPYTTVSVNPSVTMREFHEFLSSQGVSLPNYPSVNTATVAGVIATGSHGFTSTEGSLSSHLVNVQLINGEGEFREFDIDSNSEPLDMFRSHFGLCGIIIQMTFRVEPYPLMNRIGNITYPLYNIMYNTTNLQTLLSQHHSFLATWNILSSRSQHDLDNMAANGGITADYEPLDDLMSLVVYKIQEEGTLETGILAETLEFVETNFTLGDGYMSGATQQFAFYTDIATMEEADEVNYPVHVEMAISINRNTYNGLSQALNILLDEIYDYATSHSSLPVHNIQFGFWAHNSSCLLCHSNIVDSDINPRRRGDLVLMVNFQFLSSDDTEFLSLLDTIYTSWRAANIYSLPHLGKYVPQFMYGDIVDMMSPRIDRFRQLRLESGLDSIDLFTNNFLDNIVFYDIDRPASGRLESAGNWLQPFMMSFYLVLSFGVLLLNVH